MEKLTFLDYSLKNIPIAGQKPYMKQLINQTCNLIRKCRWKAFFHENKNARGDDFPTYGFKSSKPTPAMPKLFPFENALYDLVCNVKFDPYRTKFQKQLSRDIRKIRDSKDVLVKADKTTNVYAVPPDTYNKLLNDSITKDYRKAEPNVKQNIDEKGRNIARGLRLADRMEVIAERDAFITLKDHKEDFNRKPAVRLINPTRDEIGVVSKHLLAKINTRVRKSTGFNQWQSTGQVIDWFKKLPNRQSRKFIKFDIVSFYPSISEDLLTNSLSYARTITDISTEDEAVIWHARHSLLFSKGTAWVKKDNPDFDVTMGAYDGAEVCELVGLFLLSQLSEKLGIEDCGLYRDDGLSAKAENGPQADRLIN